MGFTPNDNSTAREGGLARPAGLRFALMYTAAVALGGGPAFLGVALGRQPIMYDDQALSGPDVQLFGVVMLLMGSLPAGVLAWGLWRERSWTRAGLLIWWIGLSAVVAALGRWLPPMVGVVGVLGLLLYAPAFWWYLFRKRTVAEYYASVERAV